MWEVVAASSPFDSISVECAHLGRPIPRLVGSVPTVRLIRGGLLVKRGRLGA